MPDNAAIDRALEALLADGVGRPPRLMAAMRHAVLGPGKRLRPRLVLLAAEACGGDPTAAMPAACAVELVHAYSLVHDDLPAMDDDDLRRGRPTVHKAFDEATAILAGDALLALALESVAAVEAPASITLRAVQELAVAAGPGALVGGQADDLAGAAGAPDEPAARLELLEAIHRRKTGAMISVSLRLGAIVAEAGDNRIAALTAYGDALGLLFQVTDDLLDASGDEVAVGKRVGKDAEAGKLTYPGLLGVEASRERARGLAGAAEAALAGFGASADPLRRLARQTLQRDR
ncbi:MAG: polyprenyl synthetase family protein [Planctomycetota bacterium]